MLRSVFYEFLQKAECLEICFSEMCEDGRGGAVCLCVALLDMMRDDIMVDAAAAVAAR